MLDFFGDIFRFIGTPLYYAISFVLVAFHKLFSTFLAPAGGAAWALSIIGLTLVIRAALIPLFVKQIKSSRNMQLIQPKVKELQKKYGHDRERLAQETMKLYKDSGTNPFSSCLPILLQMPIFFALFRLLDNASHGTPKGVLTAEQAEQFGAAKLFGVVPALRHLPERQRRRRGDDHRGPARDRDDGDHVPHPAPADEQEHAGGRADRARTPSSRSCCSTCCPWSSPSAASRSRSASSSTGPPRTCGPWASSST